MILSPGVHPVISADDYHADRLTDQPSLSASIAVELVTKSPAHAKAAHPRLNPYLVREDKKAFDLGSCVHSLLLENRAPEDVIYVVEHDSWRTNAAKEAAEYARGQGMIPLLDKDNEDVLTMATAARRQIGEHTASPPLLSEGKAEVTLTFELDGVACRSRIDWLRDDFTVIEDLKTSSRSADPHAFSRNLYQHGYDVKASFYRRGVRAITGIDATFRWIVVETAAPYALSVVTPGPDVLALADDKVDKALQIWRQCLKTGDWPGYDKRVATAELPPFEEIKWMERSAA